MRECDLTSGEVAKLGSPCELMQREWAPCRFHCPVHADVRAYVELVARGQWLAAIDVIRERLPFASVCGRICHHPCEADCRRDGVDEAVAQILGEIFDAVNRPPTEGEGAASTSRTILRLSYAKAAAVFLY